MNYGFIRVASASLKLKVADPAYNKEEIKKAIDEAVENDVRLLVTPELSITGYTCADLFFTKALLESAKSALGDIAEHTRDKNITVVVGMPYGYQSKLYDCAFVISDGKVNAIVPKQNLANHGEFCESRWFTTLGDDGFYIDEYDCPMHNRMIIELCDDVKIGVELGEDLWVPEPPSARLALEGADIIVNLSASDEYASKARYRRELVANQSARCVCAYVYSGASVYESTTDLLFGGATIIAENGEVIAEGKRFSRENVLTIADIDIEKIEALRRKNTSFDASFDYDVCNTVKLQNDNNDLKYRFVDAHPFVPSDDKKRRERCAEIFNIQAAALARRVEHIGSKGLVVGISGGLDSTLALLVSVEAMKLLGKKSNDVLGVTMPGFGTTDRTYHNAIDLMKSLGVEIKEISIKDACIQHMKDIGHDESVKDVTYENTQARERTQILFDMANKHGRLLVGTGDLSELAMGWCTFNGDHMSQYGVNASVPKTLVRYLVRYVAEISDEDTAKILYDVLDTPVSPELLPPDENGNIAQKTEDNIGPYELHDFFLYQFVRFGFTKEKISMLACRAFQEKYDKATVDKWLEMFFKRFFISQFKRSCSPDSPKVGSVSLSPRGDWKMPSDALFNAFI